MSYTLVIIDSFNPFSVRARRKSGLLTTYHFTQIGFNPFSVRARRKRIATN